MKTLRIPHTDLQASVLALGCMGLGGGFNPGALTTELEDQARSFLDAAAELGANFFDHANIYAFGRAEEVFGRVLKERPALRDGIILQSKCGIRFQDDPKGSPQRFDFSADHIQESVNVKAAAALVAQVAQTRGVSAEAVVLAWLLKHPAGLQPVLGTVRPERMRACAQALHIELSREEWYSLFAAARGRAMP